eukprot:5836164-Amphidinium_carterae.1
MSLKHCPDFQSDPTLRAFYRSFSRDLRPERKAAKEAPILGSVVLLRTYLDKATLKVRQGVQLNESDLEAA